MPTPSIPNPFPSVPDETKNNIYKDAVQPAAKETGKLDALPIQVVNKILNPLREWATSGKENTDKLYVKAAEKLSTEKEENVINPPNEVAVPVIIANSYTDSEYLRELYANLLANSMKKDNSGIHPAFVEIIKQLSPDEALFLKTHGNLLIGSTPFCTIRYQKKRSTKHFFPDTSLDKTDLHPQNIIKNSSEGKTLLEYYFDIKYDTFLPDEVSMMIENFERLKLIKVLSETNSFADAKLYSNFYKDAIAIQIETDIKNSPYYNKEFEIVHIPRGITLTTFGSQFYNICVK